MSGGDHLPRTRGVQRALEALETRMHERGRRSQKQLLREFELLQGRMHAAVRDTLANARVELGRLDYEPVEILMRLGSARTVQRLRSCAKEPWTVAWIESQMGSDDVLYDVGANVGAYSLVAARKPENPVRKVVAFEPGAPTFATLCENLAVNRADEVVLPLPVTLGRKTELGRFRYRDLEAGAASHAASVESEGVTFEPVLTQQVLVYRLDDLVEQFTLPRPTHLKLDVDGAELDVLEGAREILSDSRLRSALVEVHADQAAEVQDILHICGLRFDRRVDERAGLKHYWYALFGRTKQDLDT